MPAGTLKELEELTALEIGHARRILESEKPTHHELMWVRRLMKDNGVDILPEHPEMKLIHRLPFAEDKLAEEA